MENVYQSIYLDTVYTGTLVMCNL